MDKDALNLLAAKALRARLHRDGKAAAQFEKELEALRNGTEAPKAKKVENKSTGPVEIVSPLDANGNLLPSLVKKNVNKQEEDFHLGGRRGIKREAEDPSIADMQRAIYNHSEKTIDEMMVNTIMKHGRSYRPLGSSSSGFDEEDDIDIRQYKGKDEYMTDAKKQEVEMKEAIKAHKKWEQTIANCYYCYDSDTMPKDNLIALGDHTYLTMCSKMRLNRFHVQICPLQHVWSQTECDEDVIREIRRFQQALAAMARSLGKGIVFFEEVHLPRGKQHCVVECVMVPEEVAADAPIYFRKAMLECDDVWQADNRKCMDIGEKGIQRAVPKGFPYMLVEWETKAGERGALVHVIEDEKVFKRNFAQDVLAGMMDLPTSAMLRSGSQETASVLRPFLKIWRKFDWTEELDACPVWNKHHYVTMGDSAEMGATTTDSGLASSGLQEDAFVKEFTTHCNL
ncbi:hypothetical protein WA577_003344 [Blastocystis sp. JDR]